ncbi:MAG: hypothetical protein QJR02_11460 [Sinobacteraceae bacterium]|nr:hypothetical protein [Nevskiaceae bacterium]
MSALLRLSTPRLEKALVRAGVGNGSAFSVRELRAVLERRGMSDQEMHALFFQLIRVLEPPSCFMTHCKHFGGSGAPMNCSLERVPGRCSINREYKQRKASRAARSTAASFKESP